MTTGRINQVVRILLKYQKSYMYICDNTYIYILFLASKFSCFLSWLLDHRKIAKKEERTQLLCVAVTQYKIGM